MSIGLIPARRTRTLSTPQSAPETNPHSTRILCSDRENETGIRVDGRMWRRVWFPRLKGFAPRGARVRSSERIGKRKDGKPDGSDPNLGLGRLRLKERGKPSPGLGTGKGPDRAHGPRTGRTDFHKASALWNPRALLRRWDGNGPAGRTRRLAAGEGPQAKFDDGFGPSRN